MHNHEHIPQPNNSRSSEWENIAPLGFTVFESAPASSTAESEAVRQNRLRQEGKLINAFVEDTPIAISDSKLSETDYTDFYEAINDDRITDQDLSSKLQDIKTPFMPSRGDTSPDQRLNHTFSSLDSRQERRILSLLTGSGFEDYDKVVPHDLNQAIRRYPTPVEFAPFANDLLHTISAENPPEKVAEYQDSLQDFAQKFYGKRQEYYDVFRGLKKQAEFYAETGRSHVLPPADFQDPHAVANPARKTPEQDPHINNSAPEKNYREEFLQYASPEVAALAGDPSAIALMQKMQAQKSSPKPAKSGLFSKIFHRK